MLFTRFSELELAKFICKPDVAEIKGTPALFSDFLA